MYRMHILWLCVSLWFPTLLYGQTHPLNVLQALLEQHNATLMALRTGVEAAAQRPDQVGSLPDPSFGVSYLPLPVVTARGEQRSQWRLEQAIPFPGTLRLRQTQALFRVEATEASYESTRLTLIYTLQRAYFEGYRIRASEALIRDYQQRLEGFEEAAASLYSVGRGPQQAILKAQLERNTLDNRLLQLDRQYQEVWRQLTYLLNAPVPDTLSWVLPPWTPLPPVDTLVARALRRHPDIQRLRAERSAAEAGVALQRKRFYPDVRLSVQYMDIANRGPVPSTNGRDALAIGLGMRLPLQRKALRAGLEEARLRHTQIRYQLEDLEIRLRTDIRQRYVQLTEVENQLDLLENTLLPQADMSLEATLAAYQTGRADFLDLLDAERMRFTLQLQRVELERERYALRAELARLTGQPSL